MPTEPVLPIVAGAACFDMALIDLVLASICRAKIQLWWRGAFSVAGDPCNGHVAEQEPQASLAEPAAPPYMGRIAEIMIKLDWIEAKIDRLVDRAA
ncbi:MAG: hypothetical protein V4508_15860 [Pseudomonadota bacterium]